MALGTDFQLTVTLLINYMPLTSWSVNEPQWAPHWREISATLCLIHIYMQCGQAVFYQAKLHYLPSPLSAVPAAPENVTLTNISSQLLVRWTIDPPNGMISHYTIYVTRVERGNTLLAYTSTNTEFDIPSGDLDPFELVSVSVSAGNSAGEGARSLGVRGRTREERKSDCIKCDSSFYRVIKRCYCISG